MQQPRPETTYPASAVPFGPPTVFASPAPVGPRIYERYLQKQSIGLGVTQIIIGVLCIIFNGVSCGYLRYVYADLSFVGHGFWCGIMFIITGGLGIGAGRNKTSCFIVSFMVMCIITASLCIALLTVGLLGALIAVPYGYYDCRYDYYGYDYSCDYGYGYNYPCYRTFCNDNKDKYKVVIAMESLLAIMAFIGGIATIWGSAICCKSGVCCCSRQAVLPVGMPVAYFPQNGQMVLITQAQGGQLAYQPAAYPQVLTAPPPYAGAGYVPMQVWAQPPQPMMNLPPPTMGVPPPAYPTSPPAENQTTDGKEARA